MRRLPLIFLAVGLFLFSCGKEEIVPPPQEPQGPQEVDPVQPEPQPGDKSGTRLVNFCILLDGQEYYAVDTEGTELSIFVPVDADLTKLTARFSHNAASVKVNGVEQVSGETVNDFHSFKKGVEYVLESESGKRERYTVRVLNTQLPVVSVRTDSPETIGNYEAFKPRSGETSHAGLYNDSFYGNVYRNTLEEFMIP